MADTLTLRNRKIRLVTDEGQTQELPESALVDMFEEYFAAPLAHLALPDGVKFLEYRDPKLVVVHQTPPRVHLARWIADDSPAPYGPRATYRDVRISLPYCIIIALFHRLRGELMLSSSNEVYFSPSMLTSRSDRVCYPALLNISRIPGRHRDRPWICVQNLPRQSGRNWVDQLGDLIEHTYHSGYNRSSEEHEGASFYSVSREVPRIHPISEWVKATEEDEMFGCRAQWLPAPLSIGELIEAILEEDVPEVGLMHPLYHFNDPVMNVVSRFMNFVQRSKR